MPSILRRLIATALVPLLAGMGGTVGPVPLPDVAAARPFVGETVHSLDGVPLGKLIALRPGDGPPTGLVRLEPALATGISAVQVTGLGLVDDRLCLGEKATALKARLGLAD